MEILDNYVSGRPSNQNILDLFDGEWSSKLPDHLGLITKPGSAGLFEDPRIAWAEAVLGSFINKNILELGPLEGGHSYMLQNRGAAHVTAIEANTRAFLKCLCIKEVIKLDRVEFKLGDFMAYLEESTTKFDFLIASGVLYHMENPIKLLKLMSKSAEKILIWTQYFDEKIVMARADGAKKFTKQMTGDYEGFAYQYSTQSYHEAVGWGGFCGGPMPQSKWLTRESIIGALKHYGFTDIQIGFDQPDHPNGPAFAICAKK